MRFSWPLCFLMYLISGWCSSGMNFVTSSRPRTRITFSKMCLILSLNLFLVSFAQISRCSTSEGSSS